MPRRARAVLALLLFATVTRPAEANHALALFRGERHGPLAPQRSTNIGVEREELAFDLAEDVAGAQVTAVYHMTAASAERASVAFAYLRRINMSDGFHPIDATIEVDGAPVAFEQRADDWILEPRLRAWIAAHPDVERVIRAHLAKEASSEHVDRAVRAAGGTCGDACRGIVEWYPLSNDPEWSRRRLGGYAMRAAREVIPEAVEDLRRGWCTLEDPRRLGFFLFDIDFAAAQTRTVTVRYEHTPSRDSVAWVPGRYTYEYLLSPAKRWASFGPLDIAVRLPADSELSSALPFRRDGDTYRVSFATLPDGELAFSVVPTRGLWLGLSRHRDYWAILVAGVLLVAIAVGVSVGWCAAARPAKQRALLCLVVAGALASLAAHGALVLLQAGFPRHALAFDNGLRDEDAVRPEALWPPCGAVGAMIALGMARLRARRAT